MTINKQKPTIDENGIVTLRNGAKCDLMLAKLAAEGVEKRHGAYGDDGTVKFEMTITFLEELVIAYRDAGVIKGDISHTQAYAIWLDVSDLYQETFGVGDDAGKKKLTDSTQGSPSSTESTPGDLPSKKE